MSGIDIDFRRARDRTTLLLDQWRNRDLHSIRRCHSGNQQEQALKEKLLGELSALEQAAKPHDNLSHWRVRSAAAPVGVPVQTSRLGANPGASSHSSPEGGPGASAAAIMPDSTSDPTGQGVGAGQTPGGEHVLKFPALQAGPTHLRNLVPPDAHVLSPSREGGDLQLTLGGAVVAAAAAAQCQQPPEKLLKNNQGQRSNAHFSQSLFDTPGAAERRSTGRASDMSGYRPDHLSMGRANQPANVYKSNAQGNLGSASLDGGPGVQLVGSPGGALRSNPGQLDAGGNAVAAAAAAALEKSNADAAELVQLRLKVSQLEHRLEEEIRNRKQRQENDDRRLQWERERENQRVQLEKERIEKEYEDRKEEREDRRRRDLRDKEERDRLFQIISRHRLDPNLSDTENAE